MIPVLWLCGPPGVGKTSVAWRVWTGLREGGVAAAYVDIDQLGMCYPERDSDPGRYRVKARNLASVVANFAASGATCAVASAREMDAGTIADLCVDTTGLSVSEAVVSVVAATAGWRSATGAPPPLPAFVPADGPVLWVGGVPGVGTSMVGYAIYERTLRSGRTVGYLDLRQIGFGAHDRVDHWLRAANVAAVWRVYRDLGADGLVIVGEIDADGAAAHYARALPAATLTVCRLHADRADLAERIMPRGARGSWPQPGDPLLGLPVERLRQVVERGVADGGAPELARLGVRVDTGGRGVEETADEVLATGVWPLLTRGRPGSR